MFFITGDTHGDFRRFRAFCEEQKTTTADTMIILGDAGINYDRSRQDLLLKRKVAEMPLTFFCIQGNHEMRPGRIASYKTQEFCGGLVWYEPQYPNILFAKDGEVYRFGEYDCLVIGGAYSVDKMYRVSYGLPWFADEQPSEEIKAEVEQRLRHRGNRVDVVLSHTCPLRYEPTEVFLPGLDQSRVDQSTEIWLEQVEAQTEYRKWYCGHFHTSKKIDRLQFMFEDIECFGVD